ncbi:MAG: MBL fold metallo-hydrolase [Burkholderiaceae bacterium]
MTSPEVPRVNELAPGVWQFVGARRSAHTYLLKGTRRVALVDSGLPTTTGYLDACLAEIGLRPADLDLLLLTHEHIDHAGGAAHYAPHCIVAAHPHAANKLHLADEFSLMNKAFSEPVSPFEVDLQYDEGTVVDLGGVTLEVIHTPGHCSGSVCLYVPQRRMLVSGDTIMAHGIVGGVLMSGNTSDYISSLQRLQRLRIDGLLPGHGRISSEADADLLGGLARLRGMIDDSHTLFTAMRETGRGFDDVMRSLRDLNVL